MAIKHADTLADPQTPLAGETEWNRDHIGSLAHGELTSVTSDQHHAQAHTLASHSTKAHSELTGVAADDHHAQLHAAAHKTGGGDAVKLDELAAPTDVTTLNAATTQHGLLPKLDGSALKYLNGTGAWTTPAGSGGGDFVKLAEVILGADTATIDFSSIPATYTHLRFIGQIRGDRAATNDDLLIRFNNDSGANYDDAHQVDTVYRDFAATAGIIASFAAASAPASVADNFEMEVPNYAGTTWQKAANSISSLKQNTSGVTLFPGFGEVYWRNTAAINRVTFLCTGANKFKTGSIVSLYGIK